MRMCVYQSMTLRSLAVLLSWWSSQGRRGFPCIKGPALLSRLISLPPAAPMVFAFRGQRGSQSTASGGEPCVQLPSNRGCQMRPGGSARQLSRPGDLSLQSASGSCPPNHMHRPISSQPLQASVAAATRSTHHSIPLLCSCASSFLFRKPRRWTELTLEEQQPPDRTGLTG